MDSVGQLPVFLLCALAGIISGVFYDLLSPVRRRFGFWTSFFCDALFFLALAGIDVLFSVHFGFPAFRFYMFLGNAVGIGLYLKSVHRIVDFFEKLCYNSLVKIRKRRKKKENGRDSTV
ncbi:MAG: spore cortex biosynthesis protein YabQ [Clostridia bacterium]|nr:spore cortex biosynthesis protein YabQ [Clostridia bacterium]